MQNNELQDFICFSQPNELGQDELGLLISKVEHLTKLVGQVILNQNKVELKIDNIQTVLIAPENPGDFLSKQQIPVATIEDLQILNRKLNEEIFRMDMVSFL